jgi:replicative DNA helicase
VAVANDLGVAMEQPHTGGFDRQPPQDIAAEQAVLGGMLLSKDAIADVVEVLRTTDFYRPAHQTIYDTVLDMYGRGEPADAVTVSAELTRSGALMRIGGAPYLHTLMSSVPTAANAGYYAEIVAERAVLRRLIEAGTRIVQLGYGAASGSGGAVDEVVDRAQAAVYEVTEKRLSEDYVRLEQLLTETMDEIDLISSRGGVSNGVPTGFADLDQLTNGLHPGQMIIVAARPALGKSTLALDLARSCAIKHGQSAVIFSLEMGRTEITMRLLSAESKVPLHHMRSGRMSDEDWAKLARRMGEVAEAPLYIDDSPNLTLMEIRAKSRRLKQRQDLKMIIVDYLQLMGSPRRAESRQQEVSEFSRALKLLAKELEVPVIALSQLNRGPEQRTDKKPMLSDLRESGCLTAETTLLRADTGAPITFGKLLADGSDEVLVWSFDAHRRLVPAPITKVFPSGVRPVHRLTLASGRQVNATGNHPFLTFSGWSPLETLAVGDRVAIPRRLPEPLGAGIGWTEQRLGLLAHLIGGGRWGAAGPVRYSSDDEASLGFVETAAAEFGLVAERGPDPESCWVDLTAVQAVADPRTDPLLLWFDELGLRTVRADAGGDDGSGDDGSGDDGSGGDRPDRRRIPEVLYAASNAEIATFLRHLWATGGHVTIPKDRSDGTSPEVYYDTDSRVFADGLALLLSRFGIVGRIRSVTKHGGQPGYVVAVAGGPALRVFCEQIGVHGRCGDTVDRLLGWLDHRAVFSNTDTLPMEAWALVTAERHRAGFTERQFQDGIGIRYSGSALYARGASREQMLRCADALGSDLLRTVASDDVFWDRVTDIELVGDRPVFDATVKDTHNFIADGIAAHNSLEQDADMVILLHREDAYEKESPRAGEADLILAKNRNGPTGTVTVAFQGHYSRFVDMQQG